MESRIKILREKRGLIQAILATELGITQQTLSKYEKDVNIIKIDVLKRLQSILMLQQIICWDYLM